MDEDHSINSPLQSRHLFQAMTDFLNNDCYANGYRGPTQAPTQPTTLGAGSIRGTFTLLVVALLAAIYGALY